MDCSASVEQMSPGRLCVTVKTQKKQQVFAWEIGDRIASKLFDGIEAELAKQRVADTHPTTNR